ncbi:hypothetical protein HAX54_018467, partial [Datura stramonium]|nr:hypothetical protein [Datura stramonium]
QPNPNGSHIRKIRDAKQSLFLGVDIGHDHLTLAVIPSVKPRAATTRVHDFTRSTSQVLWFKYGCRVEEGEGRNKVPRQKTWRVPSKGQSGSRGKVGAPIIGVISSPISLKRSYTGGRWQPTSDVVAVWDDCMYEALVMAFERIENRELVVLLGAYEDPGNPE